MSESITTKNAIAAGFRTLMEKKSFEKITISDITDECGLNRQTFYYHFKDKYDLLNWIFYNEIITPLAKEYTIDKWSEALLHILYILKNNSKFYTNALNTSYSNEFRQYLFNATSNLFSGIIDSVMNEEPISDDEKRFIAEFMSYGVSGSIINWILTGMKASPENIVLRIKKILNDSKNGPLRRYFYGI